MERPRYLLDSILEDLKEKMVFIGGPRQVGKTTFVKNIVGKKFRSSYYNWDNIGSRMKALRSEWSSETEMIILDEFHKFTKWKSWIKGEYDLNKERFKFILTGSARLNLYRRGGDSLQGRYYYYTLFPFSLAEIENIKNNTVPPSELKFSGSEYDITDTLIKYGGFPEPLLRANAKFHRRWIMNRIDRLLNEDIRDLTLLRDVGSLLLLSDILKTKVASVLSINSIANDLQLNFRTVSNWIDVLENFYYCFRIPPYNKKKIKSVKKEKKIYFWDWSAIDDDVAKIENMVAVHLLKFIYYLRETEGYDTELYYLRDVNSREVDFLVSFKGEPWFSVEVKSGDKNIAKNILYFKERLKIPYTYQVVNIKNVDFVKSGVRVISLSKFLSALF